MKKKIGIVGLGAMGGGVAQRLLEEKYPIIVYDIQKERIEELEKRGAEVALNPKDLGTKSDTIIVMVFNGSQAKKAVFGENGIVDGTNENSTLICMSSIGISEVKEIEQVVVQKGIRMIDSPVSGNFLMAKSGELTLMLAGEKRILDESWNLLQILGNKLYVIGEEIGMGQLAKICNQVLVGATFTAAAECMVLGYKAGLNIEILAEIIGNGVCGSTLFKTSSKSIVERSFRTGSHIGIMMKDMDNVLSAANELQVPLLMTSVVHEIFKSAMALLSPDEDSNAIIKVLENIAGIEVKK